MHHRKLLGLHHQILVGAVLRAQIQHVRLNDRHILLLVLIRRRRDETGQLGRTTNRTSVGTANLLHRIYAGDDALLVHSSSGRVGCAAPRLYRWRIRRMCGERIRIEWEGLESME